MVLYESKLLVLTYDASTDVLSLEWPDVREFIMPEMEKEVTILIDTIIHYDIKKLVVDTSHASIQVNDAQYQEFLIAFATRLTHTRLQKFARIITAEPEKETQINTAKETTHIAQLIDCRSFSTMEEAKSWLNAA